MEEFYFLFTNILCTEKNTCLRYKHTYMHTDICIYFGGNAYTEIDGGKLTFFPFFCSFCTDCSANPYAYIHISPLIVYAIIKHSYDYFIATYFREYRYRYTGERCINCMYWPSEVQISHCIFVIFSHTRPLCVRVCVCACGCVCVCVFRENGTILDSNLLGWSQESAVHTPANTTSFSKCQSSTKLKSAKSPIRITHAIALCGVSSLRIALHMRV